MPPAIEFACPHCGHVARVAPGLAGKQGRCSSCRKVLEVPSGLEPRPSGRATAAAGPLLPYSGAENPAAVPRASKKMPAVSQEPRESKRVPVRSSGAGKVKAPSGAGAVEPPAPPLEELPLPGELDEPPDDSTAKIEPPKPPPPPTPPWAKAAGAAAGVLVVAVVLALVSGRRFDCIVLGLSLAPAAFVAIGWRGPPWPLVVGVGLSVLAPPIGVALCLFSRRQAKEAGCEGIVKLAMGLGGAVLALNLVFLALRVLGPKVMVPG